ncbi:endonuclease III [Candidatus Woesearchaeota archaeon]|nr:endonuclease III [Candidatus Woesearchaeota archaeon]
MIQKIISELKKHYSHDEFAEKNNRDPYKVLISCILSLRTKDTTTYPASKRLFRLANTPKKMLKLTEKQIRKAIYPVGFYKTKAKRIKEISKKLINEYNSIVPNTIEELLNFKGIGRKTANIVVTFGYNLPGIAVDTHVHRISNRIGLVKTKTPEKTEFALRKKIPKKYWIVLNELLVRHGQNICRPVNPKCSECMIIKYCKYGKTQINRKTKKSS